MGLNRSPLGRCDFPWIFGLGVPWFPRARSARARARARAGERVRERAWFLQYSKVLLSYREPGWQRGWERAWRRAWERGSVAGRVLVHY